MDLSPQESRKRQSDGQSPTAKRGRSSAAQEHFRLMDLPAEIRRMILKDLLCSEEPIPFTNKGSMTLSKRGDRIYRIKKGDDRNAKRQLFPETLAACRQLHREGSELLFQNTIGIHLCKPELTEDDLMELYDDDWDFYWKPNCEPVVLGNRYNTLEKKPTPIPSAVSRKIRRVHITLYGAILPDDGSNYLQLMEDAPKLLLMLEQHPNWKAITVEIVDMPVEKQIKPEIEPHGTRLEQLSQRAAVEDNGRPLRALMGLRGRVVTCKGVEPGFAAELVARAALPGPEPFVRVEELVD